jgi:hypothetical protein
MAPREGPSGRDLLPTSSTRPPRDGPVARCGLPMRLGNACPRASTGASVAPAIGIAIGIAIGSQVGLPSRSPTLLAQTYLIWCRIEYSCKSSPGYTARMKRIIAAVAFIIIALWLGIYVVPDLIANMLPGEP